MLEINKTNSSFKPSVQGIDNQEPSNSSSNTKNLVTNHLKKLHSCASVEAPEQAKRKQGTINIDLVRVETLSKKEKQEIVDLWNQSCYPFAISKTIKQAQKTGFLCLNDCLDITDLEDEVFIILAKDKGKIIGTRTITPLYISNHKGINEFAGEISWRNLDLINEHIKDKSQKQKFFVSSYGCVHKNYRKQGISRAMYQCLASKPATILCFIDERNKASLKANDKIGFQRLGSRQSAYDHMHLYGIDSKTLSLKESRQNWQFEKNKDPRSLLTDTEATKDTVEELFGDNSAAYITKSMNSGLEVNGQKIIRNSKIS